MGLWILLVTKTVKRHANSRWFQLTDRQAAYFSAGPIEGTVRSLREIQGLIEVSNYDIMLFFTLLRVLQMTTGAWKKWAKLSH